MRDILYEQEKKQEAREAREEKTEERLEEFISELCTEFEWEPLLDYNRAEVKEYIKKVLGKGE